VELHRFHVAQRHGTPVSSAMAWPMPSQMVALVVTR
jgi:hypothetical protein